MKCPSCDRNVDADGVHGGELLHLPEGAHVWVTGARCPYPKCASLVLAYAENGALVRLVDRDTASRAFATRAMLDTAQSLFAACFACVFVASPLVAIHAALAHPTRGAGSALVVFGGSLLVLPAIAFLVLCAVAFAEQWKATQSARTRVVNGAVSGLRLVPSPDVYR
jgi:hypothetical protein